MRSFLISVCIFLTVVATAVLYGGCSMSVDNAYAQSIGNYWTLSDRASTLPAKSAYLDQFVAALRGAGLDHTYDAVWLKNPENGFDQNFQALLTLQARLHEIEKMNVASFEYQQAISQITAQEQGEAGGMLDAISGCWYLKNHIVYWAWVEGLIILALILLGVISGFATLSAAVDNF